MKGLLMILAMLMAPFAIANLPVLRLDIKTVDEESGKGLIGSVIEIYSDGNLVASGVSAEGGNVERIDLPINQVYTIYFRYDGYVTKVAEINANCSRPSALPKSTMVLMHVTMLKKVDGIDLDFMETTPVIKYKFDAKGWMTFDRKYTEEMMEKINGIRGIEEKKK